MAFSSDGITLASSGDIDDTTVRLWDLTDRPAARLLGEPLLGHNGSVQSVAFSPDGTILASGSADTTV